MLIRFDTTKKIYTGLPEKWNLLAGDKEKEAMSNGISFA
jgi:hypothetical protein